MIEGSIIWTDIKTHNPETDCPIKYGYGKNEDFIAWTDGEKWYGRNTHSNNEFDEFNSFEEIEKECLRIDSQYG